MKSRFPTSLFASLSEIAEARQCYLSQHEEFFGLDGVAANLPEDASEVVIQATWRHTLTPPADIQDNWTLLMLWAFWAMWSEYTLAMFIALSAIGLYLTGWVYYGVLSPLLKLVFGLN